MTQSTLVKQTPETVLNPHEDPDAHDTANPRYLLTIDESVVEKVASLAAQKVNGIIDELNKDGTLPALAEKYDLTLALDAE